MRAHHEHLGHLLWELSARATAMGEAELAKLDLSNAAQGMLDRVADQPGISIAELARQLPKSQQAVSQVVARLESLGFLGRKLLGGRTIGLYLTATGTKRRKQGAAIEHRVEQELDAMLGSERYERLRALLIDARRIVTEKLAAKAKPATRRRRPAP